MNAMHRPTPIFGQSPDAAKQSARVVVPLLMQLIHPKSVVDVGCGLGTWLSVFQEWGVKDVLGLDRECVDRPALEIPASRFQVQDLEQPFSLGRRFDLILSLEVAEHLSPDRSVNFIDDLTILGSIILFSSAIPFQGGIRHANEQWPQYWTKLFEDRGFLAIDCLRMQVWENDEVDWCYAQNMVLFVERKRLASDAALERA